MDQKEPERKVKKYQQIMYVLWHHTCITKDYSE